MKPKQILLIFTLLALAVLFSGCTGRASMIASGWAGVTADEETAYIAFNTQVFAVNLTNGTERWRSPQEPDSKTTFYAAPSLTEDGQLIVSGYDNILYSLNPETGRENWRFEDAEGRYVGGTLVGSETLYAPNADHKLYALTLNREKAWTAPFETAEPLWARPALDEDCGCVYLTSMDHKVYALDAQTGTQLWSTDGLGGAIVGTPAISDDGSLYVGTFANELVALDAENGSVLWRFAAQDWVWAGPALGNGSVYFGDLSGTFYAVDRQTGLTQWQIQPGGNIVGTPLVTEDGIYFTTTEGSLVLVNDQGAIRWNQPLAESLHAGPIAAGDMILVASSNPENLLIAVDANGVKKWSYSSETKE